MNHFLITETLIIELLLVVSLVAIAVRRLRVPYTVALVLVGLLITFGQPSQLDLTPDFSGGQAPDCATHACQIAASATTPSTGTSHRYILPGLRRRSG